MRKPHAYYPPTQNRRPPSPPSQWPRALVLLWALVAAVLAPGCSGADGSLPGEYEEDVGEVEEQLTAGANLALGRPTTSSSEAFGGVPSRAVDGNTSGVWASGSIAHTDAQLNPWIQVDLQDSHFIGTVILWGRTDCCAEQLSNLRLRVSDDEQTWQDRVYTPAVGKQTTFAINRSARYVRVQLEGTWTRALALSEIQVFGPPNLALGKTATQSSVASGGDPMRAVDGSTSGVYVNGSVTHTNYQNQPSWQVDLGAPQNVGIVEIYNRTDCCADRLSNFRLLVSENNTEWTSFDHPGQAQAKTSFTVNRAARWVKVQLNGTNYLSLAEVKVYPMANAAVVPSGAGATPLGSYPTIPVGAVDGDFNVDAQGAATYSVPIKVPPGTRGVEPKLSLSYRSGGSNGLVGVGWSLAGMPMVTRCPRTLAQDNIRGGVNGDANDRFCLDGQRLIAIGGGVYGAHGTEYRTELETYSRVFSYGTCGTGPCRFEVTDKTGNLAVFGETNMVASFDGSTPRVYALNRLKDPNGNYLSVSYIWDAGQIYPSGILYTMHDAAPNLKQRRVTFHYEDRPDKEFAYVAGAKVPTNMRLSGIKTHVTAAAGWELVREYRLAYATSDLTKRSLLASLSECDAKGVCLPATQLAYNSAGAGATKFTVVTPTGTGEDDYQNRMRYDPGANLYPVDLDGDARTDLLRMERQSFAVDPAANLSESISLGNGYFKNVQFAGIDLANRLNADQVEIFPLDYNGDGRMDFIRREKNEWDDDAQSTFGMYINDPATGFNVYYPGTQGDWGDFYQGLLGADGGTKIITGDFNGDGRGDFIRQEFGTWADNEPGITFNVFFSTGGSGDFNVVTPTGSGYGSHLRGDKVNLIPGDFNGDGKTDFIRLEKDNWDNDCVQSFGVYYSKGDGYFDIFYPGQNVCGNIFQDWLRTDVMTQEGGSSWFSNGGAILIPGDYNGDGKTDFIRQQYGSWAKNWPSNNFNVYFSTGKNGNFERVAPPGADYAGVMNGTYVDIIPLDYNGDGKTDFIRREKGSWADDPNMTFGVYVSRGDGTFEVFYPGTNWSWGDIFQGACGGDVANIIPADYDGDGKTDLVRQEWGDADDDLNISFNVFFANGDDAGDYLKTVTNGLGGTVDVTYATLSDPSVYTKGTGATYPNVDFGGPMYVVKSTTVGEVGEASTETHTYTYSNGLVNAHGRGFLGFGTVNQSGPAGASQVKYNQLFPYTGMIKQKSQKSGANSLVTDRTYSVVNTFAGVYAVLPATEEITHAEGSGASPPSYKTGKLFIYDAFGNVAVVRDLGLYGDPSDDVDSCTVWYNDAASWRIAYPLYSYVADSCDALCNCAGRKKRTERYYSGVNVTDVYEYDDLHYVWLRTGFTYDVHGNVATKTVPGYTPIEGGAPQPIVETTTYDADYGTFPISQTRASTPLALTTTFAYDPRFGALAAQTDANGNTTTNQFDGLGRVAAASATSPAGYVTPTLRVSWGWDAADGNHRVTMRRNSWDTDDWRWEREYLDGRGRVVRAESQGTDPAKPVVVKREYDAFGEVSKESMPFYLGGPEVYTTYTRDWLGRVTQVVDVSGSVTNVSYSVNTAACARCAIAEATTEAAGTWMQATSTRHLDVDGHVLRQVDADNRVTSYAYDKLGRQVSMTDAAGTTTHQYDSLGRVLSTTSPDRSTITNTYHWQNGWLAMTTDGNWQQTKYSYDPLGRVIQKQIVNKETVTFTYDNPAYSSSIGRLTNVTVVPAGQAQPSSSNAFSYTPDGRIATNVITIDTDTYTVTSAYDPEGRLRSFTYPDGSVLSRQYNAQGLLSQLSIGGVAYAHYGSHNASGQPLAVSYGSGSTSALVYDSATHLTKMTTTAANATKLLDYSYTWGWPHRIAAVWDARDNARSQTFKYSPAGQLVWAKGIYGTLEYGYDDAGNMTSKEGSTFAYAGHRVTSGPNFSATYDGAGNRVTQTRAGAAWAYHYDGENRLRQVSKNGAVVNQLAYDFTGQRVKKIDANGTKTLYVTQNFEVTFLPDGRRLETKYVNDASGRVAAVTVEHAPPAAALLDVRGLDSMEALYNKGSLAGLVGFANNRLAVLRAQPWAPALGMAAASLAIAMAAARLARRRSPEAVARLLARARAWLLPPATPFARRHPLYALAIPLVLASFVSACNRAPTEGFRFADDELTAGANGEGYPVAGTYYFHNNYLASSAVVTDATGQELARTEYKPYGEIVQSASPGLDIFRSKFTGKEWDKDSEIYHFNARAYDPFTGRFLTADSMLSGGSPRENNAMNPYAYANNNPVVYTDPSGHLFFLIPVIVGVIVGAYAGGMAANGSWNPAAWNWRSWQTYVGIGVGGLVGGITGGMGAQGGIGATLAASTLDSVVVNGLTFLSPQGNTLEGFTFGVAMGIGMGVAASKLSQLAKVKANAAWGKAVKDGSKEAAEEAGRSGAVAAGNAVRPRLSKKILEAATNLGEGVGSVGMEIGSSEGMQRLFDTGSNTNGPRTSGRPAPTRADGSGVQDFVRDVSDAMLGAAGAGDMMGRLTSDFSASGDRQKVARGTRRAPAAFGGFAVAF